MIEYLREHGVMITLIVCMIGVLVVMCTGLNASKKNAIECAASCHPEQSHYDGYVEQCYCK